MLDTSSTRNMCFSKTFFRTYYVQACRYPVNTTFSLFHILMTNGSFGLVLAGSVEHSERPSPAHSPGPAQAGNLGSWISGNMGYKKDRKKSKLSE